MTFARHNLRNLALFFLTRPWSRASRVVSAWQSWAPHAPDNLWSNMHLSAAFGGSPSLSVGGSYAGSLAGLNAQLDKLYHLAGARPSFASVAQHPVLEAVPIEAGYSTVPVHACRT